MKEIFIHIGLHKTATTYLQKVFFPLFREQSGYVDLRSDLREFLLYMLYCDDLEFKRNVAIELFNDGLNKIKFNNCKLTISDEQFCGSPWDNARDRKRYFDRLNLVFPNAKYILILRNQKSITQSLYLQYIKTGGSCNWKEFLSSTRYPLSFARKSYLDYGSYIGYIRLVTGVNRLLLICYEQMQRNRILFLKQLATFIGFNVNEEVIESSMIIANPSVTGYGALFLRLLNKISRSERQPFLLLPRNWHKILASILAKLSKGNNKKIIPENELMVFCQSVEKKNDLFRHEGLQDYGY